MDDPYLDIRTPLNKTRVTLGTEPITIGRSSKNLLVVTDNRASRMHCVISRDTEGVHLRDLGSSNGTLLNGKPVLRSILHDGDLISIGSTHIRLFDPASPRPHAAEDIHPGAARLPDGFDDFGADDADELTEADVVDDDQSAPSARPLSLLDGADALSAGAPSRGNVVSNDAMIPFESDGDADVLPMLPSFTSAAAPPIDVANQANNFEQVLQTLADSLPEKPFGEADIGLINARGQLTHPAGPARQSQRREIIELLRLMLLICARSRATDIHLEPKTDHYQLRIRIDGNMVDVSRLSLETGVRLSALVKILCDVDVTQKSIVQEGHFASRLPGSRNSPGQTSITGIRRVDYRVSFAPSMFGQKLVIRVFDASYAPLNISDLQLPRRMADEIVHALQKQSGMFLVCGPTGSGKTTTLYALVRSSDVEHNNVVTIEDPVEVQLDGVTQMQVNEAEDKSFSTLLRSVLRQDPDSILVGEIRDSETARTAMQAAVTGHMVFSTVHTTNAVGTIFRLFDLGVEPYLVAQGLHIVLAQRLVRQLCPFCKQAVAPTPHQLAQMGRVAAGLTQVFVPRGCPRCLGTGHAGRRAFFEMLSTTDELRNLIMRSPSMEDIRKSLTAIDFVYLDEAGYQLVVEGAVSFDEIYNAVGK